MLLNRAWADYSENEILPTIPNTWSDSQNQPVLFQTVEIPQLILKKQLFTTVEIPKNISKNISKKGSNSFMVLNVDTESDSLSESE